MSAEESKAVLGEFTGDFNAIAGDVSRARALYDKYCAPGYVHHDLAKGDISAEQRLQATILAVLALPDLTYTIEDMTAEGDRVAARYTMRATHKGTFMGISATGKRLVDGGLIIYRLAGRKIAESWEFPDTMGLMTQLRAMPGAAPER